MHSALVCGVGTPKTKNKQEIGIGLDESELAVILRCLSTELEGL